MAAVRIHVSTNDSTPMYMTAQHDALLFGGDGEEVSAQSQLEECSNHQLTLT